VAILAEIEEDATGEVISTGINLRRKPILTPVSSKRGATTGSRR
jgi:hypothetical protein